MIEGLLWFDRDPQRPLPEKVKHAATRYHAKFGHRPNICYLNAADFDGQTEQVDGVRLQVVSNVLQWHLWVGCDEVQELRETA